MITYNHEKYLKQAVESVLDQKIDEEIELIIADDCSTDNTQEIINSIINKHPKGRIINYHRHSFNLGMSRNFIWALKKCNGKYIAYCEGDDYWTDPNKLNKQVKFLEKNNTVSFLFHRTKLLYEDCDVIVPDRNDRFFKEGIREIPITGQSFIDSWQIGMQTLMFRNDLISDLKFERFKCFRDVHLLTHLVQKSNGACQNFFGSIYRIHQKGIHSGTTEKEKLRIGYLVYNELFLYYNLDFIKIILINYLHDLIICNLKGSDYVDFLKYFLRLIVISKDFRVFGHYLKKILIK